MHDILLGTSTCSSAAAAREELGGAAFMRALACAKSCTGLHDPETL